MDIFGLQKTSLLDFPGHVAATVFLGGCNFRCPFCHNRDVVLQQTQNAQCISEEAFFAFLRKRQNVLEGVCVTGGEPTLSPGLPDFLRHIRQLGFLIKLDSNGYRPKVLASLLDEKLLDYIAMDIKGTPARYPEICGLSHMDIEKILESAELLKNCPIPYEFRTTTARELQTPEDFHVIGQWLSGARAYYLQSFQDCETLSGKHFTPYSKEELYHIGETLKAWVPNTHVRGADL